MEQGWKFDYEDFQVVGIILILGYNVVYYFYGIVVLGEMFQVDNVIGGVGIVFKVKGWVIFQYWLIGYNIVVVILDVVSNMVFGDIFFFEVQENDFVGGQYYWFVFVVDVNFDVICLVFVLGIIVIEVVCNGGYDFDVYVNFLGKYIFNCFSLDYKEFGVIMVGVFSFVVLYYCLWYFNYGFWVDVYVWGENIDIIFIDDNFGVDNFYIDYFSGIFGVFFIIVGVVVVV